MTHSSQASIFIGKLKNLDNVIAKDRKYVAEGRKVVLK